MLTKTAAAQQGDSAEHQLRTFRRAYARRATTMRTSKCIYAQCKAKRVHADADADKREHATKL